MKGFSANYMELKDCWPQSSRGSGLKQEHDRDWNA